MSVVTMARNFGARRLVLLAANSLIMAPRGDIAVAARYLQGMTYVILSWYRHRYSKVA